MLDIISYVTNKVMVIKFNRGNKKNAITYDMYYEVTKLLNSSAEDESIVATILTGVGDFYSSGNDFLNVLEYLNGNIKTLQEIVSNLSSMIMAFIDYPKLLIAVVNGPAIGIAATTLGLCDIVYASDLAYFHTPFVDLSVCAEGCSSGTFVQILGRSKASEMLLFGQKLDVKDAYRLGFVSRIVPSEKLEFFLEGLIDKCGRLPMGSLKINKRLISVNSKKDFLECNQREMNQLIDCMEMQEFKDGMDSFFVNKTHRGHKL